MAAPADVYLDTDILVNLAYPELPHAIACHRASQRLHDTDSVVYISAVSLMEYAQAFRSLATKRQIVPHLIEEFLLDEWRYQQVRRRWFGYWQDELATLLAAFPQVVELPLEPAIVRSGVELMAEYALQSQDAVHLATALHYEIPVFWTCDDHFQHVDELYVDIIRDTGVS